jgi:hypothetical protein
LMGGDDFEPLFSEFRDHLKEDRCDGILDHVELPDRERPNLEDVFEQITQISASAATLRNCANPSSAVMGPDFFSYAVHQA